MALKIRLARGGAKKRPFYRIVVAEASSPRDGRFVERVGSYNPLLEKGHADRIIVKEDRVKHWLSVGAKLTDRVELLFASLDIVKSPKRSVTPNKSKPKQKAQERMAEQAQAKLDAEEAAKAAAAEAKAAAQAPAEEATATAE